MMILITLRAERVLILGSGLTVQVQWGIMFTSMIEGQLQIGEFFPVTREPARLDRGLCAG